MEFDPSAQAFPEGPPLLAPLRSDPVDPMLAATYASMLLVRWIHFTRSRRTERAAAEAERDVVVVVAAAVPAAVPAAASEAAASEAAAAEVAAEAAVATPASVAMPASVATPASPSVATLVSAITLTSLSGGRPAGGDYASTAARPRLARWRRAHASPVLIAARTVS